jgi:hypothetical protein
MTVLVEEPLLHVPMVSEILLIYTFILEGRTVIVVYQRCQFVKWSVFVCLYYNEFKLTSNLNVLMCLFCECL